MSRDRILAAGATAGLMLITPFAVEGGTIRKALTPLTVAGLGYSTAGSARAHWGRWRTALSIISTVTTAFAVERVGVRTGKPFGRYEYRPTLQPQLAGVPLAVPLAWFSMAVPAREVAHVALGSQSTALRRIVGGALALTAWDVFLDPQMTREGYWSWRRNGRYRGIPVTNFVGWLVTGLVVMAIIEVVLPAGGPSGALVAQYGAVGVMEAAAFATFFDDHLVAIAGSVAMLPVAAIAGMRLVAGS